MEKRIDSKIITNRELEFYMNLANVGELGK